jgi:arylsulfatase A-like enzyme
MIVVFAHTSCLFPSVILFSPTRSSFLTGRLPIHVNQLTAIPKPEGANISGTIYRASLADARMTMLPKKLAAAGYVSYQVGKWHAGLYSAELHPVQRGFNHSFGFMNGDEDHFKQTSGGGVDLWRDSNPAYGENGTTYGTLLWTTEAVERISHHKSTHGDSPMFMYLAYANCHCPLQVPESYEDKSIDTKLRRIYHGMANALDEGIGNITIALRAAGMWEDTWIFFTSDNGGPTHDPASGCHNEDPNQPGLTGANNWPLR